MSASIRQYISFIYYTYIYIYQKERERERESIAKDKVAYGDTPVLRERGGVCRPRLFTIG